jgi:hypothetical protein
MANTLYDVKRRVDIVSAYVQYDTDMHFYGGKTLKAGLWRKAEIPSDWKKCVWRNYVRTIIAMESDGPKLVYDKDKKYNGKISDEELTWILIKTL